MNAPTKLDIARKTARLAVVSRQINKVVQLQGPGTTQMDNLRDELNTLQLEVNMMLMCVASND